VHEVGERGPRSGLSSWATFVLCIFSSCFVCTGSERITRLKVLGLLLVLTGVLLTLSHNASPSSPKALVGDVFCLVAALCWAGIVIVARPTQLQKASPEMQLLYQFVCVSGCYSDFSRISGLVLGIIDLPSSEYGRV